MYGHTQARPSQTLRSSDYADAVYPTLDDVEYSGIDDLTEHSRVYVTRPLFGCAVSISNDTIVVGAELEDYDRPAAAKPDSSTALTCASAGFGVAGEAQAPFYNWTLNSYGNAYVWDGAGSGAAFPSVANSVVCAETDENTLTITSNGLPDHAMGRFPLSHDTTWTGGEDNPRAVQVQAHVFRIPRFPNITKPNPTSVLSDLKQLPQGPIGIALNGA